MKIAFTLGILSLILLGIGLVCIHDFTSTPTPQPGSMITITINPCELPQRSATKDQQDTDGLRREWTSISLTKAAKDRSIDIIVHVVGDVYMDSGAPYRNVIVRLPVDCDVFDAIQRLILIDFVVYAGNETHHALKRDNRVEIK